MRKKYTLQKEVIMTDAKMQENENTEIKYEQKGQGQFGGQGMQDRKEEEDDFFKNQVQSSPLEKGLKVSQKTDSRKNHFLKKLQGRLRVVVWWCDPSQTTNAQHIFSYTTNCGHCCGMIFPAKNSLATERMLVRNDFATFPKKYIFTFLPIIRT